MSDDQRFYDFLKQRIGLDVASVGLAIIERAVRQRCLALNMPDNDHYWQRLICSHDEQQALIESVIVPETWFFRYPESFATLGRLARQRLADTIWFMDAGQILQKSTPDVFFNQPSHPRAQRFIADLRAH